MSGLVVGLYNLEPKMVNAAMMKVSTYHKQRGDIVEIYDPEHPKTIFNRVYAFSMFDFTPKDNVTPEMICGGTGFDVKSALLPEIDGCAYDWTLYPDCDFSMLWFSQGCIRHCPWCIVHDKEGGIHPVKPRNLNPNGKYIKVMDNNFFASPKWPEAIEYLRQIGQPVDFQGVDVRILTRDMAMALRRVKAYKQIKIAWDNPKEKIDKKIEEVLSWTFTGKNGKERKVLPASKLMCYVLIGYNSTHEENLYRVERLRELGIDPFVMKYHKNDRYEMDFARWVNKKQIFKTAPWVEYSRSIG
jgi:hypothetical protein